jgi:hypothetical protein
MSLKHIDGFDQLQGQSSSALLASLASSGYAVSSGLAMAAGRKPASYALELQVSAGEGGATWSSRNTTVKADLHGVAANSAGRFVAVGDGGNATTSTDGLTWAALILGVNKDMKAVECNAGTFIAVGNDGTILRSTDGQAYSVRTAPNATVNLADVAYGDGKWVAVGALANAGAIFVSTDDGMTWTNTSTNQGVSPNVSVAYGDCWLVGGNSGQVLTSDDAVAFTSQSFEGGSFQVLDVAYYNGTWLALNGTSIRRSVDSGVTWAVAVANLAEFGILYALEVSGGRWIAGGQNAQLFMSDDTATWTVPEFTGGGTNTIYDINTSSGAQVGWCLVGAKAAGITSTAMIYVSLAPPTTISRTFVSTQNRVVVGFAHRATARGRIFSITGLLDMDWPAGIKILDVDGASVPIRNTWYYYEIVIDKTAETVTLYVNDTLDLVAPLPPAGAAMTSYVMKWTAENGAVALLDDVYMLDSDVAGGAELVNRLKPISIPIRMPTDDVSVEWIGSDPGPHWPLVGLLPPSTASYVRSATSGDMDLFTSATALPAGAGSVETPIIAVGLIALAQKSDLDARQLGLVVGAIGNQSEVVDTTLSISPEYSFAVFEKAPGDIAWDATNVVSTPFGIAVRP